MNEELKNEEFISKVMRHLPLWAEDESLIVLKGHLLCEEVVNDYLKELLPHYEHLTKARLAMSKKITLCKALSDDDRHDKWVWSAMKNLDSLRNCYAHSLTPDLERVSKLKRRFDSSVQQQSPPSIPSLHSNALILNIVLVCSAVYTVLEVMKSEKT